MWDVRRSLEQVELHQAPYFNGKFNWKAGTKDLYNDFKKMLSNGPADNQKEQRGLSFFSLRELKKKGKLPKHIRKIPSLLEGSLNWQAKADYGYQKRLLQDRGGERKEVANFPRFENSYNWLD